MKREVLKKGTVIMLLLTLILTVIHLPVQASSVSVTKAVVDTQEKLNAALSDKKITSITIQTNKKVNLSIPKKSYTAKRVYVKAPNAIIKNNGKFKSVNVYVTTQAQLDKALVNTTIKFTYITISTTDSKKFVVKGNYTKVGLIVNAPKATIVNNANFKAVNVYVSSQAQLEKVLKDTKVTTITISTKEAVKITIPEGNYTNIKLIVNAPKATVVNNGEFKDTIVTNGNVTVPEITTTPEPTATVTPSPEPVNNGGGSTGGGAIGGGSGNGGGSSNPTPTVPITPTPEPIEPTPTPIDPTPTPTVTLAEAKESYIHEIRTEADKLYDYMSYNEWNEFNNGIVTAWITRLNSYTSLQDLVSNYPLILGAVHTRQQATDRFVNNKPIYMTVMTPEELANNYSDSLTPDGKYYDFTTLKAWFGIEKHYYVPVAHPEYVNTMTFENAEVSTVSGSAITYNVKAWNNVNGLEDVVGIYVLEDSSVAGQYNIGAELIKGTEYQITDSAIIINDSVTTDLAAGRYGFFVKTKVPYLDVDSSGNYIYYNIL